MRRALARLRRNPRRTLGAALLTLTAGLAVGAAGSVGFALATGYERAADRADQPDVLARFAPERRSKLRERLERLPNVERISFRYEVNRIGIAGNGRRRDSGAVHIVAPGRRGYAITEGRALSPRRPGEALVERGVADAWDLDPGDTVRAEGLGPLRIAGVALSVDNVAFPLSTVPRIYVTQREIDRRFGTQRDPPANIALVWLADPDRLDVTLASARPAIFGLRTEQLLTRRAVEQVIGQAAGIVIALLAVFALVAAACSGAMLAASAGAEVRRQAPLLGVQRALGASRRRVVAEQVLEAVLVAAPAAALGLAAGALAVSGPTATLLGYLNEVEPGWALLPPLIGTFLGLVAIVAAGAAWPAWRLTRRPITSLLKGGDVAAPRRRRSIGGAGLVVLGGRFALARRGRWAASVTVLGVACAAVLLVLAVADLLVALRDDPGTLGRRYALTVDATAQDIPQIRAIRGVAAADQRSVIEATDSFSLTEPMRIIAYRGDHVPFEAPPLASGRRLRDGGEVEVGLGLADALGLRPGGQLAVQTSSGAERRLRVVGVVRALENDGRIVFARSGPFRRDDPGLAGRIAVVLDGGADRGAVARRLAEAGFTGRPTTAATPSNRSFLGILATVLRSVAIAIGLVCMAAVLQTLALTARDRRRALAVLRAGGGSGGSVAALLAGAAAVLVLPALAVGVALERLVLGPLVADLAADYATLPLGIATTDALLVGGGLGLLSAVAVAVVTRSAVRESIPAGLGRSD